MTHWLGHPCLPPGVQAVAGPTCHHDTWLLPLTAVLETATVLMTLIGHQSKPASFTIILKIYNLLNHDLIYYS